MGGINEFLKDRLPGVAKNAKRCYVSPGIPEKKRESAMKAFRYSGEPGTIIGIIDTTMLGSAKEGFLFTGDRIIYRAMLDKPITIMFDDMETVYLQTRTVTDKKGRQTAKDHLVIKQHNGETIRIEHSSDVNLAKLVELLNEIITNFDQYEVQDQFQPLEELPEELKVAYVKVIINMAYHENQVIESRQLAEILQLICRLKFSPESRDELRSYITSSDQLVSVKSLVRVIDQLSPDGMRKSLHISLVKDLIHIYSSLSGQATADFGFLSEYRDVFDVSEDEVELALMAIENDRKLLNRTYSDSVLQKSIKEMAAKASAVGVPLGTVYLSGSVAGLSAAGITSGLAALGFGGVLGFSSMVTGIGTVLLLGVVTYKGVKRLTGSDTSEADKRREAMLLEIIRQGHKTTNMLMEDINYLSAKLEKALQIETVSKAQLEQLVAKLSQYISATKVIHTNIQQATADRERLKSPEFLDLERLKALTSDASKQRYYEYVLQFYQQVPCSNDGEGNGKTVWRLKPSSDDEEMRQLGNVFEAIGYYTAAGAIRGKVQGLLQE